MILMPRRSHGCEQYTSIHVDAKHDPHRTRSGRYDQRSARTALAQKNLRDDHVVASRGPVPLPGPGVSKPALIFLLISNRRVITIALELELARVWRGYLVFFSLGAC